MPKIWGKILQRPKNGPSQSSYMILPAHKAIIMKWIFVDWIIELMKSSDEIHSIFDWSMKILSTIFFPIFEKNYVIKILLRPCCGLKFQFWNFLLHTHEKLVILSIQWHIASQKIPTLTIVKLRLKSAKNYEEVFI